MKEYVSCELYCRLWYWFDGDEADETSRSLEDYFEQDVIEKCKDL